MKAFASSFVAALSVAAAAQAGFTNPLIPSWAGGPDTQTATWETFSQAFAGGNTPDGPGSSPFTLFNFAPGSLITSTGNIYSPTSAMYIMVVGATLDERSPLEVVINASTIGFPISYPSMRLTMFDALGAEQEFSPNVTEVRSDVPFGMGGSVQTVAFSWDLSGVTAFNAAGFRVDFRASAPNMSLDAFRMDLRYVPGPGAAFLGALAALVGVRVRRRA